MESIPIKLLDVLNNVTFKRNIDYSILSIEEILLSEGYNNPDFHLNTKHLLRKTKDAFKKRYTELLKKHPDNDYSKYAIQSLKRKIRGVGKRTFPSL